MDENDDGRLPDDSPVEVCYPRIGQGEQVDGSGWPWLPGLILSQCRPDQWHVCVEARELATLEDVSPAPRDRGLRGSTHCGCCIRGSHLLPPPVLVPLPAAYAVQILPVPVPPQRPPAPLPPSTG